MQEWKRKAAAKIRAMSAADAQAAIDAYNAESAVAGATIMHATIRDLTGGFNSQSINFAVVRMLADRVRKG